MNPEQGPKVSKWLWITLVIIILIGAGFFSWYYLMGPGKKVASTSTPAATTTSTTTPSTSTTTTTPSTTNNSSNNIYTNSKFGFSFTLPSDYTTLEDYNCEGACGVRLQIGKKSGARVYDNTYITIRYSQAGETLAESKKNFESRDEAIIKTTPIKIDGQDAYEYEVGGMVGSFSYIAVKGKFDLIIDSDLATEKGTLLNNIITSFKFGTKEYNP